MPRNLSSPSRLKEGQRLKRLRTSLDLTQKELAREFGVTPGAITQWELGDRTIPGSVLRLMDIYESGVVIPGNAKKRS
jgi:transcriptional regulator with XRE-family HTH domain